MTGKKKTQPSYRDVKSEILRRITDRTWGPGSRLPGEVVLAEEFDVARGTVNRAMRELADDGLIERRRKGGTRVRPSPLREARFHIPIIRSEIEATGRPYSYQLLSRHVEPPPQEVRLRLHLNPRVAALHLVCLHLAGGKPYQLEDRWINLKALPQALGANFETSGPNEWLVRAVPYSDVEMSFLAVPASARIAKPLATKKGAPVFSAQRTTWWQDHTITHVRLYFFTGYRMTTRY